MGEAVNGPGIKAVRTGDLVIVTIFWAVMAGKSSSW